MMVVYWLVKRLFRLAASLAASREKEGQTLEILKLTVTEREKERERDKERERERRREGKRERKREGKRDMKKNIKPSCQFIYKN
jgi:hypothetical protein